MNQLEKNLKTRIEEKERRSLICKLIDRMRKDDSWAAETQIQKTVLFLQELMGVPLGYQFVLYKHGPYSFDLRSELAVMRAGFELDVELRNPYGPSFVVGSRGRRHTMISSTYDAAIEFISKEVSTKDTRSLERLSTAYFIQEEDEHDGLTEIEIVNRICTIKPHISQNQAHQAVGEVEDLRQKASTLQV